MASMASMASASPDMSLLSSHFNKIASGTGDMRSSSPQSTSSLASFYNSFVNSPYSSHQSVGSSSPGGGGTHPGWCHGQSATVDSYLITAATDQHPILQNKVKSLAGAGALVQEHSSLSSSCKGNAGAVLLQHLGSLETSREWAQQVEDTKACLQYGGSMASLLSTPTSYNRARAPPRSSGNRVHHLTEGAMFRELIDRMGGGTSNNQAGTTPSSMGVSISHRPGHPMEKLLNLGSSSCSNAPAGLTNDHPSKAAGGLATLKGGVGLAATSRTSLAQFSGGSDPGFTCPLAAKFSPFCSNATNYPQAPQQTIPALLAADDRETTSPRSGGGGGQQAHESNVGKLSPTSSTVVGLVKIAGGECISSFQNSLEGTTRVNTGAQDSQAATRVRMISDDEKEPTGNGSSLPSLEAIEGARKNSVADEAAGLESFDPGESETNSFTLHDAGPHEPLEKKRKKFTAPADDCRGHASSSLCPPESVVFENDNTLKPKRCKNEDGTPRKSTTKEEVQKPKAEGSSHNAADNSDNDSSQGRSKEINTGKSSHADLCKQDYIHVRARRGQATDSHSLAERIRREKISERMKHLQDLVPGCSKVTGKAVMLDEIINYVQSLQRQVEHLSMRLATVPAEMDVNFDTVSTKEMMQQSFGATGPIDHASFISHNAKQQEPVGALDTIGAYAVDFRCSLNGNMETGSNCGVTPGSTMWDGDLQSIVQMGILQCGPTSLMSQGFNCPEGILLFEGMGMRVVAQVPKPKNNRIPDVTCHSPT